MNVPPIGLMPVLPTTPPQGTGAPYPVNHQNNQPVNPAVQLNNTSQVQPQTAPGTGLVVNKVA